MGSDRKRDSLTSGRRLSRWAGRKLGHAFARPELLKLALTHPSEGEINNRRLEFLGDAVLELVSSDYLYRHYEQALEGTLTQLRQRLVQRATLAAVAAEVGLADHLRYNGADLEPGGPAHEAMLADGLEAVFAAVWLDGGIEPATAIFAKLFAERLQSVEEQPRDAKSGASGICAGTRIEAARVPFGRGGRRSAGAHFPIRLQRSPDAAERRGRRAHHTGLRNRGRRGRAGRDHRGIMNFRSGLAPILGRPNVGKSTLLNRLLREKVSIEARKPQTTRHAITGVRHSNRSQLVLVDTPGLHAPGTRLLSRSMNRAAVGALAGADVVLMMVEAGRWLNADDRVLEEARKSGPELHSGGQQDRPPEAPRRPVSVP